MCPTGTIADDRGFTLVELLVVLALLSLAAVMTLTWLPGLQDRWAVDRTSQQVTRILSRAANVARTTGADQVVGFAAENGPRLVYGGRTSALDPSVDMKWLGASGIGVSADLGAIVFLATGGSTGATIELSRRGARADLEIDWLTGNVRRK
jgi:prepilin-type N-terminal cleavage/methylation domain-containing protein